jgi:hypothetical protein
VELKWSLRDGERTKDNNNSSLIIRPRLSETTTGRTIALIFRVMERATISELSLVSPQDGGRCLELKENS